MPQSVQPCLDSRTSDLLALAEPALATISAGKGAEQRRQRQISEGRERHRNWIVCSCWSAMGWHRRSQNCHGPNSEEATEKPAEASRIPPGVTKTFLRGDQRRIGIRATCGHVY